AVALSPALLALQLEPPQPGGAATDESLYASGPYGLARPPLHRSARSARPSPDGAALQLTLDSTGARSLNRPTTRPKPLFPQQPLATLPAILDSNGTDPFSNLGTDPFSNFGTDPLSN